MASGAFNDWSALFSFAQTPAHIAAFGGHPHCLLWLLQAGAYINKQDYVGETPVHKAARAGSMDCLKALVSNGAQIDFRNASDLTAADLAHSQGFRECAQFLLNLQNRHLNGLYLGGSISGAPPNIPSSHFNGGNNRKRSFNELEISSVKKPRTEVNGFGAVHPQSVPGYAEEENMHVENHSVELSDLNGSSPFSILTNGHAINKSTAQLGEMEMSPTKCLASPKGFTNGTMTNGKMEHEHGDATENQAGAVNTLCGSFNVSGSPTEWVAHSPSWGDGVSDCLLYGHYHGFGDTAESLPELSSMVEHSNSVKVEYKYNSTFISTLHQYQGF
uniref:Ankyrin repeat domain 10 n=1 Tax=Leptobrachium leishanense TaxID=445787 RepID=A0A8C5M5F5_9ANUR